MDFKTHDWLLNLKKKKLTSCHSINKQHPCDTKQETKMLGSSLEGCHGCVLSELPLQHGSLTRGQMPWLVTVPSGIENKVEYLTGNRLLALNKLNGIHVGGKLLSLRAFSTQSDICFIFVSCFPSRTLFYCGSGGNMFPLDYGPTFPPPGTFFGFDISVNIFFLYKTLFPCNQFFIFSSLSNNNSIYCVFSVFYVSDPVLRSLRGLSYFSLTKA